MEKIDRKACKKIHVLLQNAIDEATEGMNIHFKVGNMSFDEDSVNIKVSGKLDGALSKEAKDYERYQHMKRLVTLGTEVEYANMQLKIIGYKPRATKRPILVEDCNTNKRYVVPLHVAQI